MPLHRVAPLVLRVEWSWGCCARRLQNDLHIFDTQTGEAGCSGVKFNRSVNALRSGLYHLKDCMIETRVGENLMYRSLNLRMIFVKEIILQVVFPPSQ